MKEFSEKWRALTLEDRAMVVLFWVVSVGLALPIFLALSVGAWAMLFRAIAGAGL